MKVALIGLVVVILMGVSGGIGYYYGNDNGLKSATNIRAEFFTSRATGTGTESTAQGTGQRGNNPNAGQGNAFNTGRPTATGTVKSVQGNSITVTQQDGTTTTVTVDDKTQYTKLGSATLSDVTAGLRIVVTDQNGVKRIQLTPAQ